MRTLNEVNLPPLDVYAILHKFGIRPKKGLGQNFLVDENILHRIVAEVGITREDIILEIGPGLGNLTRNLAVRAGKVVAVELDEKLFPALESTLKPFGNIQLVQGDFLEMTLSDFIQEDGFLVVANIPYYISSAVIRHLLEGRVKPRRIVLTVQKEISERICETKKLSMLAVSVQVYGTPSIRMDIPAQAFYPVPNVDSSVVQIDVFPSPMIQLENLEAFFKLARAGFGQKRKTLRNSLSSGLHLPPEEVESMLTFSGIDHQRRAETLQISEWGKLTESYLAGRSR